MAVAPFQPIHKPGPPNRLSNAEKRQYDSTQAIPKGDAIRIRDPKVLKRRRQGRCQWPHGPHWGRVDPAHIVGKGAGGGDTEGNCIGLCRKHHDAHHDGTITDEQLLELVQQLGPRREQVEKEVLTAIGRERLQTLFKEHGIHAYEAMIPDEIRQVLKLWKAMPNAPRADVMLRLLDLVK